MNIKTAAIEALTESLHYEVVKEKRFWARDEAWLDRMYGEFEDVATDESADPAVVEAFEMRITKRRVGEKARMERLSAHVREITTEIQRRLELY